MMNPENNLDLSQQGWAYPVEDVEVDTSETGILGRGAFGTVRIARWCGTRVAAKQLHALTDSNGNVLSTQPSAGDGGLSGGASGHALNDEDLSSLIREFSVMAQLRHPNLVLFLGVTYNRSSALPVAILTELMSLSLYDLLETQKVRLEAHEVLGISVDLTNALVYLHGRTPHAVVHRDLSARNVLLDRQGRAKLADLGQAKVLGVGGGGGPGRHSLSQQRNTTMPGAMAYAAPEVLTGRYSSPIDLFSFGVLLAQLCTGEYPRIDRREEQVQRACAAVPALEKMLQECLELHPEQRPSAVQALGTLSRLHALSANERFNATFSSNSNGSSSSGEDGDGSGGDPSSSPSSAFQLQQPRLVDNVHCHGGDDTALTHAHGAGVLAERWFRRALESKTGKVAAENAALKGEVEKGKESALRARAAAEAAGAQVRAAVEERKAALESARSAAEDSAHGLKELCEARELSEELSARLDQSLNRWGGEKVDHLKTKQFLSELKAVAAAERAVSRKQASELEECRAVLEEQTHHRALEEGSLRASDGDAHQYDEDEVALLQQQLGALRPALDDAERELSECAEELEEVREAARQEREAAREEAASVVSAARDDAAIAAATGEKQRLELERTLLRVEELEALHSTAQQQMAQLEREVARTAAADPGEAPAAIGGGGGNAQRPWSDGGLPRLQPGMLMSNGGSGSVGMPPLPGLLTTYGNSSHRNNSNEADGSNSNDAVAFLPRGTVKALMAAALTHSTVAGSVSRVVALMINPDYSGDAYLLNRCLKALKDLTSGQQPQPQANKSSGMDSGSSSRNSLTSTVVSGEDARLEAGACGACSAVVAVMVAHAQNSDVQKNGARTIGNLSFGSDGNRALLGHAGACQALADTLTLHSEDADLHAFVFASATNLSHNSDANRVKLCDAGFLNKLVGGMARFASDLKVQRQACWALLTLAASDQVARHAISRECGAGAAVVASLVNFPADASLQHFGCWAIANLAWQGGGEGSKSRNRDKYNHDNATGATRRGASRGGRGGSNNVGVLSEWGAGAVEVCRAAVRQFPHHAGVSEKSRLALEKLSFI